MTLEPNGNPQKFNKVDLSNLQGPQAVTEPKAQYPSLKRTMLEQEVRDALTVIRARELCELYHQPEAWELLNQLENDFRREFLKHQGLVPSARIELVDRNKTAINHALSHYLEPEEYKNSMELQILSLLAEKNLELDVSTSARLEILHSEMADTLYGAREQQIQLMTDLAENEGLEAAVTEENLQIIRRELFPTKNDYIDYIATRDSARRKYIKELPGILGAAGEEAALTGHYVAKLCSIYTDADEALEIMELEHLMESIWGN